MRTALLALIIPIVLCWCYGFSFAQKLLSQNDPNRLFASGRVLVRNNALEAAKHQFHHFLKIALKTDPRIPEALYYEAFCGLNLYHANGEKKMIEFITDYPQTPRFSIAQYDLAYFFCQRKEYKKALLYFEKIDFSTLDKERYMTARFYWGYSLFNFQKFDQALEQFNFVKFLNGPFGPAANYYAGFIELNSGKFDSALVDLKRAEKNPSYAKILPHMIASAYYKQNKYDDLLLYVATLKQDEIAHKENIDLLLAEVFFKQKKYKNAFEKYQQYYTEHDSITDKALLLKMGLSAYFTENDDKALRYLKSAAIPEDSIGFAASYYLGLLYLKKDFKPLAMNAFSQAMKHWRNSRMVREATFKRAKILYDLSRYDETVDALEKIIKTYPNSDRIDEAKTLLSKAYVNASNYDRAMAYIEALPSPGPAVYKIYQKATWLKGVELFNKEDYTRAISFFEKSLQHPIDKKRVAETNFWNGEAYSLLEKYDKAIASYLQVIALSGYADAHLITQTRYVLGYAFFNLKRYERALYNFTQFVDRAGDSTPYPDGLLRLADCYYVTKDYTKALSIYKKYLSIDAPEKDYALLQTGVILSIQQQYTEAMELLDGVIKDYPTSRFIDEAIFQKAQLNFEQGNYSDAISEFTRLINTYSTSKFIPYAYVRRAASYYNLKKYKKTITDYAIILQQYTSHPVAKNVLLPLQEALGLVGKSQEFQTYLDQYKAHNPDAAGLESIEFETAERLYFNQDYQGAINGFENYIKAYPTGAWITEALYYQAESHYRLNQYVQSLKIHKKILENLKFPRINKVISRVAELEYKMKNYTDAAIYFNKLAGMASTQKEQVKAWSGMMQSYFMLQNYDSVDFYAHRIIQEGGPGSASQSQASLFLGKLALAQKDYQAAKDEFLYTINIARDEYGAEAKYLLGEVFFLTRDYKQCYETLIGLNTDFAPYTQWVGKSFLLLSDNFVATGDIFQAKATLNSLIKEFPLASIRKEAQQKLTLLNTRKNRKKASQQNPISQPDNEPK